MTYTMDAGDLSPVVSPANRKMLAQEMTDADKMYERGALVKVFRALDDDMAMDMLMKMNLYN